MGEQAGAGEVQRASHRGGGLRWVAWLAAAGLAGAVGAGLVPGLWTADGSLATPAAFVFTAITVLVGFGVCAGTAFLPAACWAAGLVLAQAVWLQLVDAGPLIHYEHWRPATGVQGGAEVFVLAVLALWALAVAVALLGSRGRRALGRAREAFGWRGWLAVGLLAVLPAAFPSRDLGAFGIEELCALLFRIVQLGALALAVVAIPQAARQMLARRIGRWLDPGTPAPFVDRLAVGAAIWVVVVAALLAIYAYQRHPHVPDEVAYLFQARTFAHGWLRTPAPPVPAAFDVYLISCGAHGCFSPFPPGWPAALSLGVRLGVPWLVNPILGGAAVLLAFLLVRELYDRRTARATVLLLAVSPWLFFLSMSWMSHAFSLVCALAAAYAVARLARTRRLGWAAAGGLALGWVSLTRPLEGFVVALVLGLAALAIPGRRWRLAPVMALGLSSAAVGALVLPYNAAMTGHPLRFPVMVYMDQVFGPGVNELGFGPNKGTTFHGLDPFPGHGLRDVVVNDVLNTTAIDEDFLGWTVGSLLALAMLLGLGRFRRADGWMAFFLLVLIGVHSFYWFSGGPDFAARYWYLAIAPLAVLSARGLLEAVDWVDSGSGRPALGTPVGGHGAALLAAAAILSLGALVGFVPWRAVNKYHHFRGMRPDLRRLLAQHDFGSSLILIRGRSHPDLASAIPYEPLNLRAPAPVFFWDRSPEIQRELRAAYPQRPVWVLDGPSRTGAGYRVVAGPIAPGQPIPPEAAAPARGAGASAPIP